MAACYIIIDGGAAIYVYRKRAGTGFPGAVCGCLRTQACGKNRIDQPFYRREKSNLSDGGREQREAESGKLQQKHSGIWNRDADGHCVFVVSGSTGVCVCSGRKGTDRSGD